MRKITVTPAPWLGPKVWVVRRWENDKPRRTFFHSKAEAEAEAAQLRLQRDRAGEIWLSLSAAEREKLVAGLTTNGSDPVTLATVISELEQAKTASGRSRSYISNLKIILNDFADGKQSKPINAVSLADLELYLDSKSLASRSTLRARLSTLFKFSIRRGYRNDNPCARLEPVKYLKPPPSTFTVQQFAKAWKWSVKNAPQGLAWLALSTCCGLRPEEAEKTTKRDIHFGEGFIKVEAQTTKVRQRRIVYPRPEAMALVKTALKLKGRLPFGPRSRRRYLRRLRKALGFPAWPKDITRHTAATYWLATGESASVVSAALGNSEKVLNRDYKALKTRMKAVEFWNIVNGCVPKKICPKGYLRGRHASRRA